MSSARLRYVEVSRGVCQNANGGAALPYIGLSAGLWYRWRHDKTRPNRASSALDWPVCSHNTDERVQLWCAAYANFDGYFYRNVNGYTNPNTIRHANADIYGKRITHSHALSDGNSDCYAYTDDHPNAAAHMDAGQRREFCRRSSDSH